MPHHEYWDKYLGADLGAVDPDIDAIIEFEEERQARKLIMIPSESIAPLAVRQALGSVFNNVYAEGYPPLRMTRDDEDRLLDYPHQLAYYRRYADRRFYKGVDYVHFVETLAQRRAAHIFAGERVSHNNVYVNVQPLSGAAANLAVYDTFLQTDDTVMGMDLFQGGHLTHGSEFNFSGKRFRVASYGVSKATGKLDYDEIRDLARRRRPKMIIAGFTSYTWAPDWQLFADIAREVGAILLADISHPAGMATAGAYPNPVGIADVVTCTTHKTLCGPRGAIIMTTDEDLSKRIDMAVFPGEQGGPHTQKFAAMAVAFKIAATDEYKRLMWRIKENAAALADGLTKRGLKLAYGGTDTHFCMLDLNSVKPERRGGVAPPAPLRGEPAVRILDMAGIVANKNTIPGDTLTALGMGIRLGTPWLTQRGFGPAEIDRVAALIHKTVTSIHAFSYIGLSGELPRGKIDLDVFEEIKREVAELAAQGAVDAPSRGSQYPHYYTLPATNGGSVEQAAGDPGETELRAAQEGAALLDVRHCGLLLVSGERAEAGLNQIVTPDVPCLKPGEAVPGFILDADGVVMDDIFLMRLPADKYARHRFIIRTQPENHERVKAWLRGLGDGYILFDRQDVFRKVEGPLVVEDLRYENGSRFVALAAHGPRAREIVSRSLSDTVAQAFGAANGEAPALPNELAFYLGSGHVELVTAGDGEDLARRLITSGAVRVGAATLRALRAGSNLPDYSAGRPTGAEILAKTAPVRFELCKPYMVGQHIFAEARQGAEAAPAFEWREPEDAPLKRTTLYDWHKAHTRHIVPFAGWEMPVWYTGVMDEHNAVRKAAGLFDVSHMGVFEATGPHAEAFLDLVLTNYVRWYAPGESFYAYLLDVDGNVIDDLLVYRRARDNFQIVVNASNADKDWAWLNAVNNGEALLDRTRPEVRVLRPATLRNLKDPASGDDRRVDLALQGPASMRILQSMTDDARLRDRIGRLPRTGVDHWQLAGFDLVVARTGYTGEDVGYEIFVHPDRALALWEAILDAGQPFGLQPAGLAARDSTRTEAGLPLYGHELAGPFNISPAGARFAAYVKLHKPYFIGRDVYLEKEKERTLEVARFRMAEKGVRMPKTGDPVVNKKGQALGWVTSAAVDVDGVILGLAYIQSRYAKPGEEVGIFNLPQKPLMEKGNKAELQPGDKIALSDAAVLLPRFPDKAERARWRE
jgi:glycine cleavage system T protein